MPRQREDTRVLVVVGAVLAVIGALFAVGIARLTDSFYCDENCARGTALPPLYIVQLVVAVAGLVPLDGGSPHTK